MSFLMIPAMLFELIEVVLARLFWFEEAAPEAAPA